MDCPDRVWISDECCSGEKKMKQDSYIATLDGWRAVAILMVMFSHSQEIIRSLNPVHLESLFYYISFGSKGVHLFFAISGFIIGTKLFNEISETGTIHLRTFYERRFFRLFPTIATYLSVLIIFSMSGFFDFTFLEFISCIIPFRNYIHNEANAYTGIMWSLSVEEHFYFLLPSLLLFLGKYKKVLLGLVSASLLVAVWRKLGTVPSFVQMIPLSAYHDHNTFGRLDGMFYGVILAYFHHFHRETSRRVIGKIPLIVIIASFFFYYRFNVPFTPAFIAMTFPFLIYKTVSNEKLWLSKILESRLMSSIGKWSYSLYVWHTFFFFAMPAGPLWGKAIFGKALAVPLSFLISYLNFTYIETPVRRLNFKAVKAYLFERSHMRASS